MNLIWIALAFGIATTIVGLRFICRAVGTLCRFDTIWVHIHDRPRDFHGANFCCPVLLGAAVRSLGLDANRRVIGDLVMSRCPTQERRWCAFARAAGFGPSRKPRPPLARNVPIKFRLGEVGRTSLAAPKRFLHTLAVAPPGCGGRFLRIIRSSFEPGWSIMAALADDVRWAAWRKPPNFQ